MKTRFIGLLTAIAIALASLFIYHASVKVISFQVIHDENGKIAEFKEHRDGNISYVFYRDGTDVEGTELNLRVDEKDVWRNTRDFIDELLVSNFHFEKIVVNVNEIGAFEIMFPSSKGLQSSWPNQWAIDGHDLLASIKIPNLPYYESDHEYVCVTAIDEDGITKDSMASRVLKMLPPETATKQRTCVLYVPVNCRLGVVVKSIEEIKRIGWDDVVVATGRVPGPWPPFWMPRTMQEWPF